jgi:NAD(P)-dependent dehydrogenase (short-subunit alcohol dehydrogenase family)
VPSNPPLTDWKGRVVWIVGASSGIGEATAAALQSRGATTIVSARQIGPLARFAERHPGSRALPLDVTDRAQMADALKQVLSQHGRVDLVMYCAGHYRAMRAADFDRDEAVRHLEVNYIGVLNLLEVLLPVLRSQRHGHLSLVASVAGWRGLPQAMAYGPGKAAMQYLADTLYLDLRGTGVGVSVVNPGFVATPLTAGNTFHMPALLTPEDAARHILEGWAQGRYDIHFPKRFTLWLKLLRLLPHWAYVAAVRRATGF